jgi:hypothetical protein
MTRAVQHRFKSVSTFRCPAWHYASAAVQPLAKPWRIIFHARVAPGRLCLNDKAANFGNSREEYANAMMTAGKAAVPLGLKSSVGKQGSVGSRWLTTWFVRAVGTFDSDAIFTSRPRSRGQHESTDV